MDTPTPTAPKRRRKLHVSRTMFYFLLPILLFVLTSIPGVNVVTPYLALGVILALIVIHFVPHAQRPARVALWTLLVLSLVGSTGWFYSPFFFALYLTAVGLGFLYSVGTAIAFTLALMLLFAFSVGEVNATYDFLTLLSLLSVIPLTVALRRSFLLVQQERKGILILESDDKQEGVTTLDAILANRVNRIGILLRQPITYLKQGIALLRDHTLTPAESQDVIQRMQHSSDELFTLVKEFERGATKNDLLGASTSLDGTVQETKQS